MGIEFGGGKRSAVPRGSLRGRGMTGAQRRAARDSFRAAWAKTTQEGTVAYVPSKEDVDSVSDEEFDAYRARLVKEIKEQKKTRRGWTDDTGAR